MERKYLTLKEIQQEEVKMLEKLIKFLEDNELEYFIWAGTFLGAVRHKGFIPWDDDIDLGMTRPMYNKLLEAIKKCDYKIDDDHQFIGYELSNSDFPYLKLINKSIEIDEAEAHDENLWIDIFPLDGTPLDNRKFFNNCQRLYAILYLKRKQKLKEKLPAGSMISRILKNILLFFLRIWKYDIFVKFYYNYCTKYDYDKCDYIKNNVCSSSISVYDKTDIELTTYSFENIKVKGIKNYDKILTLGYGSDYMELPPESKRVTHEFKAWKK